jgi:hypothetical protein
MVKKRVIDALSVPTPFQIPKTMKGVKISLPSSSLFFLTIYCFLKSNRALGDDFEFLFVKLKI